MSILVAPVDRPTRLGRRERRAERRRLRQLDLLSGRLAELDALQALLGQAAEVVREGWVQNAWFTVETRHGHHAVTAHDLHLAEEGRVTGACLVGAVVHAAGGPSTVRSQLVQRSLDLTWHTLREDPGSRVRWCPGPQVRMMQVLDLTFWNDAPSRTPDEVADLLLAARRSAGTLQAQCRDEHALLAAPTS